MRPGVAAVLHDIELAFARRKEKRKSAVCQICGNAFDALTRHHLVPRSIKQRRHPNPWAVVHICGKCHVEVHKRFTNEELGEKYYTLPLLLWALDVIPKVEK